MISQKSIQEVFETAKIEEVVEEFVRLKRRGVNMIGLCPFHNEKTPSFTVSPSKNIFKCFGCGQGGGPVQFLMEHENLSYPEAIRYLAKKYGIELEETDTSPEYLAEQQKLDSYYIINKFAADFFQQQLFESDRGKHIALPYFKERGFRESTIKKFGLGYAPKDWKALLEEAKRRQYNEDFLKELGLVSQKGFDFFRDRVMFPIFNLSGKVVGFGGRILEKKAKAPKYINSPETEIYNKSKILYGAYQAKNAIRKEDECILVEGYTDVISLHQAGIENVVASSGTSLTTGQVQMIKRYTPNIKILYDGDPAGVKAALRGLDLVLEEDMNVKVVLLPEGEDPDSHVKNVGATDFKQFLEEKAQDFIFFKANILMQEGKNDPVKKVSLIRSVVESIARIPDPIKRSLYVKECARLVDVEEQLLISEVNKVMGQRLRKLKKEKERDQLPEPRQDSGPFTVEKHPSISEKKKGAEEAQAAGHEFQERDIIRILIHFGDQLFDKNEKITVAEFILSNIEDVIEDFDQAFYQTIARDALDRLSKELPVDAAYFTNHDDKEIRELAVDLLSTPYEYSENWEKKWDIYLNTQKMPDENFVKDSEHALKRFRLKKIVRKCIENQEKIKALGKAGDVENMMLHMRLQQKLLEIRNELARELGTVVL
jgi:DNA primase